MKRQTLLGLLGTLFLGALGSGLWELIKPMFTFAGSFALSILSLGFDSIVSDMYIRIGSGSTISSLARALGLMQLTIFAGGYGIYRLRTTVPSVVNVRRRIQQLLTLIILVCAWANGFVAMRQVYVANERSHFDNLVRIAAPYMGEQERLIIDSHLARVTSKSDYEAIVHELKAVLKANNIVGFD